MPLLGGLSDFLCVLCGQDLKAQSSLRSRRGHREKLAVLAAGSARKSFSRRSGLRSKDSQGRLSPHRQQLFRDALFFALGAEDAIDGIGGAAAGLVVMADLHFAE